MRLFDYHPIQYVFGRAGHVERMREDDWGRLTYVTVAGLGVAEVPESALGTQGVDADCTFGGEDVRSTSSPDVLSRFRRISAGFRRRRMRRRRRPIRKEWAGGFVHTGNDATQRLQTRTMQHLFLFTEMVHRHI